MPTIAALTTFTSNTQAKAAEVNANFSTIRTTVNSFAAFVDTACTITGAWTFSTAPTISGAMSFGAAVTITTGGLTISAGGFTVTGNSSVTGTLTATTFSGSGASLTALDASNLGSGTVPDARFPATLPAASGANLTSLNASNISSGTLNSARLPATIAANTTGSAQSVVNGTHALTLNSGAFLTIPSGSPSCVTGVNVSPISLEQAPTGLTTYSATAVFIPIIFNGTTYHIRCERWT